ncbi:hypothetical protein IR083_05115 [Dysgonomonas sp. GY75]|uniref:hypothetical protein n=1 Tax=Dysgonomonas sp. GY75 TaxID=2780419 RepID=UPI00188354CB|nr:hypothetical protein [Dysgonomonas sp. GY75]MBF0648188.1 hypothetical protein [Dysgonomonas sp. GY75]
MGTPCRSRFRGKQSGVSPHARFFVKIPERSEDDFYENPARGLTLPVDKDTKLHLPMNRDSKESSSFLHYFTLAIKKSTVQTVLCFYLFQNSFA